MRRSADVEDAARVQGQSTFAETPDYTPILGAAKITGRMNSGYTVGLLDAVTSPQTELPHSGIDLVSRARSR